MPSTIVHLPNGQNLTVTPVFGGLYFKSNELSNHHSPFPPGWTIIINSEDPDDEDLDGSPDKNSDDSDEPPVRTPRRSKRHTIHRFKKPTLRNDHLFISSISQPSSSDFKPAGSPTRQIAMMLWATLWWYFHQPEPDRRLTTVRSKNTPDAGKPKGDWRININREGIFKGRVILPKLERMGLIASEDSSVGVNPDERAGAGWTEMFVSRRHFWQLDARIYLFTLSPTSNSPFPSSTPYSSRPSSPEGRGRDRHDPSPGEQLSASLITGNANFMGPFHSTSHLPTYYPPAPPQYTFTNDVRHPIRPKPPRQGETFYTRYIPSVGQYLSFRVASAAPKPPTHHGPVSATPLIRGMQTASMSDSVLPTMHSLGGSMSGASSPHLAAALHGSCDTELLHKWMNDPRVAHFWGEQGPIAHQEKFLANGLKSRHMFPVIGCWDGKPFGYFEIYWVKEDTLGRKLGACGDFDRGIHCLVGEQEFRGAHRVRVWLSALVHCCWLADLRTETVMLEPRVDNEKLLQYCLEVGFYKEREISFPHKQSNLLKIHRDAWEAPYL